MPIDHADITGIELDPAVRLANLQAGALDMVEYVVPTDASKYARRWISPSTVRL